jgi:MFS family permease
LLIANYVSWFGNGITIVAVPLYVLAKTGSTMAASVAGAANALPLVLSGIAGGVLVDRWGARRSSILADALAGLCTAGVPLLDRFDAVPFTAIVALLFLRSLFNSPASVARLTLLPLVTEAAGIRKQTANTLYQLAPRIALMLGPAVAGTVAAITGPAATLALDALTFAVAAALVAAFVRPAGGRQARPAASIAQDIRSGFGFVRRSSGLMTLMSIIAAMNFIDEAFIPVLLPVYSRDVLADPRLIGWLLGANGLGAVLGTLLYLLVGRRLAARQWRTFVACLAVLLLTRLGLSGLPGLVGASLALFVFGLASGPLNPIINTIVQDVTPPALHGRVFGMLGAIAYAAAPLGILIGGWLVVALDLQRALLAFAGLYAVVFAVAWRSSGLRALTGSSERLTA